MRKSILGLVLTFLFAGAAVSQDFATTENGKFEAFVTSIGFTPMGLAICSDAECLDIAPLKAGGFAESYFMEWSGNRLTNLQTGDSVVVDRKAFRIVLFDETGLLFDATPLWSVGVAEGTPYVGIQLVPGRWFYVTKAAPVIKDPA